MLNNNRDRTSSDARLHTPRDVGQPPHQAQATVPHGTRVFHIEQDEDSPYEHALDDPDVIAQIAKIIVGGGADSASWMTTDLVYEIAFGSEFFEVDRILADLSRNPAFPRSQTPCGVVFATFQWTHDTIPFMVEAAFVEHDPDNMTGHANLFYLRVVDMRAADAVNLVDLSTISERIVEGMTLDEVQTLLGVRPTDRWSFDYYKAIAIGFPETTIAQQFEWSNRNYERLWVSFGVDDTVIAHDLVRR